MPEPGPLRSPELDQLLKDLESGEIRSILEVPEAPLLSAYFKELTKGPKDQNLRLVLALERFVKLKYEAHGKLKGRIVDDPPEGSPRPKKAKPPARTTQSLEDELESLGDPG